MNDLAVRNQNDDLTPAEKEGMFAFGKATTLLSILKSRARRTLRIKPAGTQELRGGIPPCFRGQMGHELRKSG